MATPQVPRDEEPVPPGPQSTEAGRRRARVLIPAAFIAAIVLVFLFIVLVSQIGQ